MNNPQEFNGGVPGGNYSAEQAPNGTWTIKGLPIFSEVEAGKRGNQHHVGPEWMNAAIAKAKELRFVQQHMAPVHLGHHGALKNKDTPRVGFLKPTEVARLVVEGKPQWCLFADVVGITKENFESLRNLSHPYRSVEIGDWNKPEVASLALLSDESPYFKFPMLTIGQMREYTGKEAAMSFGGSDGNYHFFEFDDKLKGEALVHDILNPKKPKQPGFNLNMPKNLPDPAQKVSTRSISRAEHASKPGVFAKGIKKITGKIKSGLGRVFGDPRKRERTAGEKVDLIHGRALEPQQKRVAWKKDRQEKIKRTNPALYAKLKRAQALKKGKVGSKPVSDSGPSRDPQSLDTPFRRSKRKSIYTPYARAEIERQKKGFSSTPIWFREFSGMPLWMGECFNSQPTDFVLRNGQMMGMLKGMARADRTSSLSPGGRIDGQGFHEFGIKDVLKKAGGAIVKGAKKILPKPVKFDPSRRAFGKTAATGAAGAALGGAKVAETVKGSSSEGQLIENHLVGGGKMLVKHLQRHLHNQQYNIGASSGTHTHLLSTENQERTHPRREKTDAHIVSFGKGSRSKEDSTEEDIIPGIKPSLPFPREESGPKMRAYSARNAEREAHEKAESTLKERANAASTRKLLKKRGHKTHEDYENSEMTLKEYNDDLEEHTNNIRGFVKRAGPTLLKIFRGRLTKQRIKDRKSHIKYKATEKRWERERRQKKITEKVAGGKARLLSRENAAKHVLKSKLEDTKARVKGFLLKRKEDKIKSGEVPERGTGKRVGHMGFHEFLEGNVVLKGGRPWKKPFIPRNAGSLGFHEFGIKNVLKKTGGTIVKGVKKILPKPVKFDPSRRAMGKKVAAGAAGVAASTIPGAVAKGSSSAKGLVESHLKGGGSMPVSELMGHLSGEYKHLLSSDNQKPQFEKGNDEYSAKSRERIIPGLQKSYDKVGKGADWDRIERVREAHSEAEQTVKKKAIDSANKKTAKVRGHANHEDLTKSNMTLDEYNKYLQEHRGHVAGFVKRRGAATLNATRKKHAKELIEHRNSVIGQMETRDNLKILRDRRALKREGAGFSGRKSKSKSKAKSGAKVKKKRKKKSASRMSKKEKDYVDYYQQKLGRSIGPGQTKTEYPGFHEFLVGDAHPPNPYYHGTNRGKYVGRRRGTRDWRTEDGQFAMPLGMNGQAKRLNSRLSGGNLLRLNRNGQASNAGTGIVGDSALRRRSIRGTAKPFAPSASFRADSKAKWLIQPPGVGWYSEI